LGVLFKVKIKKFNFKKSGFPLYLLLEKRKRMPFKFLTQLVYYEH
jgi:hypothetical protein